ncbi:MAG: VOC family protein [Vicinamibacterales bacterium]
MRPRLRTATPVLLVGDLEATARWYKRLGFAAELFPPGFAILSRDGVDLFLQYTDGYVRPHDPRREARDAWDVYIRTDDARALSEEFSTVKGITAPQVQPYGQLEFEVTDPNGYVLVFASEAQR